MRRKTTLFAFLLCVGSLATLAGDGRTPIPFDSPVAMPITITESGSYVLTRNLTGENSQPVLRVMASDVTIDLNGMVVRAGDGAVAIQLEADADLSVFNGSLSGGATGIEALGSARLYVDRVRVSETSGRGINAVDVEHVSVTRSSFLETGDVGVAVESPSAISQARVSDNTFSDVAGGIGLFQTASAEVSNNRIQGVTSSSYPGGIVAVAASGVALTHNVVRNTDNVAGIFVTPASFAVSLTNNVVDTVRNASGINYAGDHGMVRDNVVSRADKDGVLMSGSFNQVASNTLSKNGEFGLHFSQTATNNVYRSNTSRGNSGSVASCDPSATEEFCDEMPGVNLNTSQGDNQLPAMR